MPSDRGGGPLAGKIVLITRPRDDDGGLADSLRERGAVPIEAPVIRIAPVRAGGKLDKAIRESENGGFTWIAFTSPNAVEAWFERAAALGLVNGSLLTRVAAGWGPTGAAPPPPRSPP